MDCSCRLISLNHRQNLYALHHCTGLVHYVVLICWRCCFSVMVTAQSSRTLSLCSKCSWLTSPSCIPLCCLNGGAWNHPRFGEFQKVTEQLVHLTSILANVNNFIKLSSSMNLKKYLDWPNWQDTERSSFLIRLCAQLPEPYQHGLSTIQLGNT